MRFRFYGKDFDFKLEDVDRWICDIIIMYGYHVDNDTLENFSKRFVQWCYRLNYQCNDAVPQDIQLLSDNYSKYLTLKTLRMCDELLMYDSKCVDMTIMFDLYRKFGISSLHEYQEYHRSRLDGGDISD